ncbi:unnamed protein product [Schistosoma mattheei]|uniref:Uncharacterized protein n=1 Tax=Schistosoma mattheei TaxID=31246 RepID=A0A183P0V9_9TREM|nr:unnamed protein product [Schistosoma mattheei]
MQLNDLDFEDDLALLSHTQKQMQEKTISVAAGSAAVGLKTQKGKSKILRYNTACTNQITLDGEDLEEVRSITYLCSNNGEHGGSDLDVKPRIGKARAAHPQLKDIWKSKQLSINTKKRKTKEHITPRNGDRREKNEQELNGNRMEGSGQSELENVGWRPMLH